MPRHKVTFKREYVCEVRIRGRWVAAGRVWGVKGGGLQAKAEFREMTRECSPARVRLVRRTTKTVVVLEAMDR